MPGMTFRAAATDLSSYAMSDTVFDTQYGYDAVGNPVYSETNHRVTFTNAVTDVSAKARTGYGYGNRAFQMECVVKPAQAVVIGLLFGVTPPASNTFFAEVGDLGYSSSLGLQIGIGGASKTTIASLPTWGANDIIGMIYRAAARTLTVYLNGAIVYVYASASGNYWPACYSGGNNTASVRLSTAWSYALPNDVLFWR